MSLFLFFRAGVQSVIMALDLRLVVVVDVVDDVWSTGQFLC